MTDIPKASIVQAARTRNSDPEVEVMRLRCAAAISIDEWSNPNVEAVARVRTEIDDAATIFVQELRDAGYAANFVINYPGVIVFALDPSDAPSPDDVINRMFGE